MSEDVQIYVLDTSAWLALIEDEEGADLVQQILEKAKSGEVDILVSFMSFMEVMYITLQEQDLGEADERVNFMAALPITRVESNSSLAIFAAKLKANYHISVADAWIAALAKERNATLVHKDPEFEQIEGDIQVLKLPYK